MPQIFPWIEQPYLQYAQKGPESNKEKNNKVLPLIQWKSHYKVRSVNKPMGPSHWHLSLVPVA